MNSENLPFCVTFCETVLYKDCFFFIHFYFLHRKAFFLWKGYHTLHRKVGFLDSFFLFISLIHFFIFFFGERWWDASGHAATCCNTLQRAVTRCITLQHAATCCNTLPQTATRCSTLQHTVYATQGEEHWWGIFCYTMWSVLQCVAALLLNIFCSVLWCVVLLCYTLRVLCCSVLQRWCVIHCEVCCSMLQRVAALLCYTFCSVL